MVCQRGQVTCNWDTGGGVIVEQATNGEMKKRLPKLRCAMMPVVDTRWKVEEVDGDLKLKLSRKLYLSAATQQCHPTGAAAHRIMDFWLAAPAPAPRRYKTI